MSYPTTHEEAARLRQRAKDLRAERAGHAARADDHEADAETEREEAKFCATGAEEMDSQASRIERELAKGGETA